MAFLASNLTISAIFLVAGLAFFIWGCFTGLPRLITIIGSVLILCLASPNGFITSFVSSFSSGAATTFGNYLLPFIGGSCLGTAMVNSGCAASIGEYLMGKFGKKAAAIVVMLVTLLISICGVTGFSSVFIVLPVALSVCRAANIRRGVGLVAFSAMTQLSSFNLIGVPSLPNILPTQVLGVSLYECPAMSITMFVVGSILTIVICAIIARKGEFEAVPEVDYYQAPSIREKDELPSFGFSIMPIIVVLVATYLMNFVLGWNSTFSAIVPQVIMTIVVCLCCGRTWKNENGKESSKLKQIIAGIDGIFPLLVMVSLIGGFGAVASELLAYNSAIEALMKINVNPYVCAFLVVAGICFITSDAIAGIAMFDATLATQFAALPGINAGALHRIVVSTACTFDSMPMAATSNNFVMLFGYTMKSGYKYFFYGTVLITTITSLIAVVWSSVAWPC